MMLRHPRERWTKEGLDREKWFAPIANAMENCAEQGIDPDDVFSAIVLGKRSAILALARELTAQTERRRKMESQSRARNEGRGAQTRNRKTVSPTVVGFLAVRMLARWAAGKRPLPRELVALFESHLNVAAYEAEVGGSIQLRAAEYVALHPKAKPGEIAEQVGVTRQAIEKWRRAGLFDGPVIRELVPRPAT